MRVIKLFFVALLLWQQAFAQDSSEFSLREFRSRAMELDLPAKERMAQLMAYTDSLQVNRKEWQTRFDSLFLDTLFTTPTVRLLVEMDAAMLNYSVAPSSKAYAVVKSSFLGLESIIPASSGYSRELSAAMLELALVYQDYEFLYRIQNRIQADNYSEWKKADAVRVSQIDSLMLAMESSNKSSSKALENMSHLAMQWHIIAVVAMVVLLIFIAVLIAMFRKWSKQRKNLSARANDTSEQEALVLKLEEARREIHELKLLAKKKVDPVPAEVHIPNVPAVSAITASDISDWNDQVQQVLIKIKGHCESGKNAMSVPTYMSIINDTTRLSAQVAKKSEQWIALLNAPKE